MTNSYKPTVLDLFCGAGGMSKGFLAAGFEVNFAVDFNEHAIKTYKENIGDHCEMAELSREIVLPRADVIIGGPPCQGFSSAGQRKNDDSRNSLISVFAHLITRLRPSAFVFENVEGFLTAEEGRRVLELLEPLINAGYRIHLRKVNAANFGVPQHRKRVIAIGALGWDPTFPAPTHLAFGAPGATFGNISLPLTPTLGEALASLPGASKSPPGNPNGHFYKELVGVDLERAIRLKPGMTMRDLPEDLHHVSFRRRAYRRVMDGTPTEKRGGAPSGLRRLKHDEPSKTITGGARNEFLHPFENRNLTIRECARLQTFKDEFVFFGSWAEQMQLIGNAVPPMFSEKLASSLLKDLSTKHEIKLSSGGLLSFIPTQSEGSSPALQKVITRINDSLDCVEVQQELPL